MKHFDDQLEAIGQRRDYLVRLCDSMVSCPAKGKLAARIGELSLVIDYLKGIASAEVFKTWDQFR